jgi:molybdopterin-guanine dinucleotide biosynthesis protein A
MAPPFSAALLAGGKSRRMGRDKALLPVTGHEFLWQRQLALLDELAPARVFWSGFARAELPSHVTLVIDPVADAGPLAGICGCLKALESDLLLVLAIDLSQMNAAFLRDLLAGCSPGRGAMPHREGHYEPLAAVYPKAMLALARDHLAAGRLTLQDFAAGGIQAGLLRLVHVAPADDPLFRNLNRPEDLELPAPSAT